MIKKSTLILLCSILSVQAMAQIDPLLLKEPGKDSSQKMLNMDAVYKRPFVAAGKLPVAVGGYVEANWQHMGTDGISDGHQFQFRRMTLFVASTISKRIKFLSEIEFEPAEKEIAIEFAAVDIELAPLLNLRGGMIMNPIGAFNQNHDGPKWEFTDRPISATQMLPATWSNAGFGLYGKKYSKDWMLGYELYLSGGFDNSIIENNQNKTYLPASKNNPERFEELNSGSPMFTGKIAARHNQIGELGISYMGGVYNKWQDDGMIIDHKRRLDVYALDFNTTINPSKTFITAEWAWVNVQIPPTYSEQFGSKQYGGFIDIVQPVLRRTILGWKNAVINIAMRGEYVDWNAGTFLSNGSNIGESLWSIMPAISFRPASQTVIRFNYRYLQQKDLLNNPASRTGGFNFGFSSYF
ncbi:MAG: hypothetical protein V4561_01010 [Bacteroidota bacterium]